MFCSKYVGLGTGKVSSQYAALMYARLHKIENLLRC